MCRASQLPDLYLPATTHGAGVLDAADRGGLSSRQSFVSVCTRLWSSAQAAGAAVKWPLLLLLASGCVTSRWQADRRLVALELHDGRTQAAWLVDGKTAWREDALSAPPRRACHAGQCAMVVATESCTSGCAIGKCLLRPECPLDGDLLRLSRPLPTKADVVPYRRQLTIAELTIQQAAEPAKVTPPSRPPERPAPSNMFNAPSRPSVSWREDRRWLVEASISPVLYTFWDSLGARAFAVGNAASIGFRKVDPWHRSHDSQSKGWFPDFSVLGNVLAGNEYGLDFRIKVLVPGLDGSAPSMVVLGMAPILRAHSDGSRWRFPSLFGAILPEIGVVIQPQRIDFQLTVDPFPVGIALTKHTSFELNPEFSILIPSDSTPRRTVFGARVGLVFR